MKKIIPLISIFFLIFITFIGCGASDEHNAKKIAEEFGENLYNVNSERIADYNATSKPEDIQYLDKTIQSLMTENEYKNLIANRYDLINIQGCAANNLIMQVTDFVLTKDFYDKKQNMAGYYYEAKLKFISNVDKNEQTDIGKGYIGLSKENGHWKVSIYKMSSVPDLIMKR